MINIYSNRNPNWSQSIHEYILSLIHQSILFPIIIIIIILGPDPIDLLIVGMKR